MRPSPGSLVKTENRPLSCGAEGHGDRAAEACYLRQPPLDAGVCMVDLKLPDAVEIDPVFSFLLRIGMLRTGKYMTHNKYSLLNSKRHILTVF